MADPSLMKPALIELALAAGFSHEAVKKWRQRGHVPAKHRAGLLRMAARRRVQIEPDDLVFVGTGGRGRN